jgi:hypothetical protein
MLPWSKKKQEEKKIDSTESISISNGGSFSIAGGPIYCSPDLSYTEETWRCEYGHEKKIQKSNFLFSGINYVLTYLWGMEEPICYDCITGFIKKNGFVLKKIKEEKKNG